MAFTRIEDAPIPQGTPFAYEGDIAPWVTPRVEAWGGKLCPLITGTGSEGDALDWLARATPWIGWHRLVTLEE